MRKYSCWLKTLAPSSQDDRTHPHRDHRKQGLAGALVANSLMRKVPFVNIEIWEDTPQFTDRSLGIGLSNLAIVQALEQIIPSARQLVTPDVEATDGSGSDGDSTHHLCCVLNVPMQRTGVCAIRIRHWSQRRHLLH
jgi:hypothetical protein